MQTSGWLGRIRPLVPLILLLRGLPVSEMWNQCRLQTRLGNQEAAVLIVTGTPVCRGPEGARQHYLCSLCLQIHLLGKPGRK